MAESCTNKDHQCCATCEWWGGKRRYDKFMNDVITENQEGVCEKGPFKAKTLSIHCCNDYEPWGRMNC